MVCFMCKGELEDKLTNFTLDLGHTIIIIKNVPSQVCKQCGEVSYSNEVAQRIEKIINQVEEHNINTIFYEELVSPEISSLIARETGCKVETLHTLESVEDEDDDYISLMRENLEKIKEANK